MDVKLIGSIDDDPNAKRHMMELAANAMRANPVQETVFSESVCSVETVDIVKVEGRILRSPRNFCFSINRVGPDSAKKLAPLQ